MSGARPRITRFGDFEARSHVPGRLSTVAALRVARGTVFALALGRPFRLMVRGKFTTTTTNDAATDETFDLSAAYPFVDPPREAAVIAYVDGSRVAAGNVTVDADANTVTVPKTANTSESVVLYPALEAGSVQITAASPEGADAREIVLYQDTLAALHETDQAAGETAPTIERPGFENLPLGPRWELRIKVNTASGTDVVWEADAKHRARFAAAQAPVPPARERELARAIADRLRG